MPYKSWKKLLVIRFSSIGDIVLTTPVVRCLHQAGFEVHYLTKVEYKSVLETNPYIHKLWTIKKNIGEVVGSLRKCRFDGLVDLHRNLRTSELEALLDLRALTFPKHNFEKWLLVNTKKNLLPKNHVVDRYFLSVYPLGVLNDGKGLDFFLTEDDRAFAKAEVPFSSYNVLVVGAKHATKQMPDLLINQLITKSEKSIVLIGGKDVAQKGAQFENDRVLSLCGKCSIRESAAIIENAVEVITPDTGMMHIAAALQKPIQSYWGSTVPEFGMTPYYGKKNKNQGTIHEVKGLECRPCSKLGFDKCPKGHFKCMMEHSHSHTIT